MHSVITIILIGILLLLDGIGFKAPPSVLAAGIALGVLLIGLPHGGLDQKIGLRLLNNFQRPVALAIFFGSYLFIAATVIAGWFVNPQMTILAFFSLSAWHFGLEEETRENLSWLDQLGGFARGGMVIWIPASFQGEAVTNLLSMILPAGESSVGIQVVNTIRVCSPVLIAILLFDTVFSARTTQTSFGGMTHRDLHRIRVLAFAVLFATADPLISFGVYFCAWHSIIGLVHLRDEFRFSNFELAQNLLPLSLLAIALFVAGFGVSSSINLFAPAVIQTIFIGLSAVAIPHLLLHIISDSFSLSFPRVSS